MSVTALSAVDPDGQSGFVVEPKDYVALAEKLIILAKDKGLRETLAQNGRRVVSQKYTLERMINSYRQLYEEVLRNA